MPLLSRLFSFLRNLFNKDRMERELTEEIRAHLEMLVELKVKEGHDPAEARRAALIELGGEEQVKERVREVRMGYQLDTLLQDLRYGVRMLLKNPGFTLIAVLTLALGIGANTTIFGLIDAVLLKMLPVKNPEQLVVLKMNRAGDVTFDFSYPLFLRLQEHNQVFSSIFAAQAGPGRVTMRLSGSVAHEQAEDVAREIVSGDYFSTLGVSAILGRVLTPEDDKTFGAHPVAVISHSFWQRRFGADMSVLGKVITLREIPFTIIGVTPPGFFGIEVGKSTDVWISTMMVSERNFLNDDNIWLRVIARLKPEVTKQQVSAEMSRILQRYHAERAEGINDTNRQKELLAYTIGVEAVGKGLSDLRVRFSQPLYVLMVIVVLLLLIACANLANLLLARAGARQKEIAVRLALGAGRLRLIRQLFTESLLLALMGGSLGLIIALWGRKLLLTFLPAGPLPLTIDLAPDLRVLGFTAAVSCMACLLFGLAPAWRTTRVNLVPALKGHTDSPSRSGHGMKLSRFLVVFQVALSIVLLIGAGLLVRSLQNLLTLDAGFNRENVLTFDLELPREYQGAQLRNLNQRILERIKNIPGVRSASFSFPGPFRGGSYQIKFSLQREGAQPGAGTVLHNILVMPGFFETMGMTLLQGRSFNQFDTAQASKVAVINESMARHFFPNENPLGKRLSIGEDRASDGSSIEIVGVVKDARSRGLREQSPRVVYVPLLQNQSINRGTYIVRTVGDPVSLTATLRREAQIIDRAVSLQGVKTIEERVDEYLFQERITAELSGFFSLLALLLTSLGLYGIMSHTVNQRTQEFGIRLALGAQSRELLKLVLGQGLGLTLVGIAIGLTVSMALTRLLKSFLFGISPTDPATMVLITLLLTAVVLFACWIPARRATKVDPIVVLKCE